MTRTAFLLIALALCCSLVTARIIIKDDAESPSFFSSLFQSSLKQKLEHFTTGPNSVHLTSDAFISWLQDGVKDPIDFSLHPTLYANKFRSRLIDQAQMSARKILGGGDASNYQHPKKVAADAYPYWGFFPMYQGGVPALATTPTSWSGNCFMQNSATLQPTSTNNVWLLTVTMGNPSSPSCSEFYAFATLDGFILNTFTSAGTYHFQWTLNPTSALTFDLDMKGIRVLLFRGLFPDMLTDLIDTALLFESELLPIVPKDVAERNIDFLSKYGNFNYQPRSTYEVTLDESYISSGDAIGVTRLDGLDPVIGWGSGSSTGHAATALWIQDQLYIVESTVKSAFWPVDGVQKTPYRTWIAQAHAAGQLVVHMPLTPEASSMYNETAALDFFLSVEGLSYGYHNFLFGWLDTPEDNYPCLPPDFQHCVTWPLFELAGGWIDKWAPAVGDTFFNEAFNKRLGTTGLKAPELFQEAVAQGMQPDELPTPVEEDTWLYNTTRYGQVYEGRSMVCTTFVCAMWKAAGVFGEDTDDINCGEHTPFDTWAINILQSTPDRPAQCVAADPNGVLCQLEGAYTLTINGYATKPVYAHQAEACASQAPQYNKNSTC